MSSRKKQSSNKPQAVQPRKHVSISEAFSNRRRFARASFDVIKDTKDNMRHFAMADGLSADADANETNRANLRYRSRYEVLNNCYAKGIVQMLANDTIGSGPRLQFLSEDESLNDKIEADFAEWAKEARLPQVLRLMRIARCQDGETFAVIMTNPRMSSSVKIKLDVIEADRIHGDPKTEEDETEVDGIRYDKYGEPVSYKVYKYHPGDDKRFASLDDYAVVPYKYMLHTFVKYRPGLHRGVPEIAAALPLFAYLRRYNLASVAAAEMAADFAGVMYTDSPANGESDEVDPMDTVQLERNMLLTMPAGWKIGQLDAKHPMSTHGDEVKVILSEIARSICSTYGTVAGNFSGFNYASGRLDNQVYQKAILVDRTVWENEVLDRILDAWLREWSLVTGIPLPEDKSHEWFWDAFQHVDPTKEANAQAQRLKNMTTTLADEYAKEGKDYVKKLRQIAKERKLMKELGILDVFEAAPKSGDGGDDEDDDNGDLS